MATKTATVKSSTTPTSSGILSQIAPQIKPLFGAIGAFQNLGTGMTNAARNPQTAPQILGSWATAAKPLFAGLQRGLGDINRFFDPVRQDLGIGNVTGYGAASKGNYSPAQPRQATSTYTAGVGPGQTSLYGGSQASQNAYAQRYQQYATGTPSASPYPTGSGTPPPGGRGGGYDPVSGRIVGSQKPSQSITAGAQAATQLTQGQWGDAARYTAQAITYAINTNNRGILPPVSPTLQSFMGYTDQQMIQLGYLPNPQGYWEPWKYGQTGSGGGGGGGTSSRRGYGSGGSGVSPSGGFSYGLVDWRI